MPGLLPGSMHGASNNFSFIGVPLYTGHISPLERLTRVGRAMSWVRHSVVVPIAIRMPDLIQVGEVFGCKGSQAFGLDASGSEVTMSFGVCCSAAIAATGVATEQ